jgi:putative membrane protein
LLRLIIAAPFLLLLVLFALSNTQVVQLGLWPTGWSVTLPLSITVLAAMAVAFFLGALVLWVSTLAAIHRARRAEHQVKLLEAEVQQLKAQVGRPGLPPPV